MTHQLKEGDYVKCESFEEQNSILVVAASYNIKIDASLDLNVHKISLDKSHMRYPYLVYMPDEFIRRAGDMCTCLYNKIITSEFIKKIKGEYDKPKKLREFEVKTIRIITKPIGCTYLFLRDTDLTKEKASQSIKYAEAEEFKELETQFTELVTSIREI